MTFAENSGSPHLAARSTESLLVALPCQTRIGCCKGRGQVSAASSEGRNLPGPGHLVLPPEPAEELVAFAVALPLILGSDVEELGLGGPVALADDELQPAAGEVVERGVVLEGADRIEQAQGGDRGEQPDGGGPRGDVAEHDRRRGGDEGALVPLADAVAVEAKLLGQDRVVDHVAKALSGRLLDPGDGVRECA